MDPKLENFLKEMRSIGEYSDCAINPPPNGITAAEIEEISQKAYSNCEPLQPTPTAPETTLDCPQAPPIAPPPDDLSYWQALVDPKTNHSYYWNSLTNEVSWTIPSGGIISLPQSTEVAVECEREMEEVLESYPYSVKLSDKFTPPVAPTNSPALCKDLKNEEKVKPEEEDLSTVLQTTDEIQQVPIQHVLSGFKSDIPSPSYELKSGKKRKLEEEEEDLSMVRKEPDDILQQLPTIATPPKEKKRKLEEGEDLSKLQVSNMVELLSKKLHHLQTNIEGSSTLLDTLAIQLQTRLADWKEGGVATKYMVEKLKKMNEDLFIYESSLTPEEWKLTSESEVAVLTSATVDEPTPNTSYISTVEVEELSPPVVEMNWSNWSSAPSMYISGPDEAEGSVVQSTGEIECCSDVAVSVPIPDAYSQPVQVSLEECSVDTTPYSPPEMSSQILIFPEAKVEPETGMHEREQGRDDATSNIFEHSEDVVTLIGVLASKTVSRDFKKEREEGERIAMEELNLEPDIRPTERYKESRYEREVEDVSDKEVETNDPFFLDLLPMEPSAIQDNGVKSVVEEEEEGLWVDEDKSEGELGDDSDDPVEQAFSKTEGKDRGCEQFGPREEKRDILPKELPSDTQGGDVKPMATEEEEEGIWVDGDRSEGELGDDSDEPVVQVYNTTDRKDGKCEKFGPREEKREDYSPPRRHHHRRSYNDDYDSDYYSTSRRHSHHRRYDDDYDRDYYRSSRYHRSSQKSERHYSRDRHHHSSNRLHSYDSDLDRDYDKSWRSSSSKHKKKDKKRKRRHRSNSRTKNGSGEEKKPVANVLIGKVGKIGTVRQLGKERRPEEGGVDTSATVKPADKSVSTSRPVAVAAATTNTASLVYPIPLPPEPFVPCVPPPLPTVTTTEVQQMSVTYYQQPSTGEVPYYSTYDASFQYPQYSAIQEAARLYAQHQVTPYEGINPSQMGQLPPPVVQPPTLVDSLVFDTTQPPLPVMDSLVGYAAQPLSPVSDTPQPPPPMADSLLADTAQPTPVVDSLVGNTAQPLPPVVDSVGDIAQVVDTLVGDTAQPLPPVVDSVVGDIAQVVDTLVGDTAQPLPPVVDSVVGDIAQVVDTLVGDTAQPLPPVVDSVVGDIAQVVDTLVGDTAQPLPPVVDSVVGDIAQVVDTLVGDTAQPLPPVVDSLVGDIAQVVDTLVDDSAKPLPPVVDSQVGDAAQVVVDSVFGDAAQVVDSLVVDTAQPLPPVVDSQVGDAAQVVVDSVFGDAAQVVDSLVVDTAQPLPPVVDSQVGDAAQPLSPRADSMVVDSVLIPSMVDKPSSPQPVADSQVDDTAQPIPPMADSKVGGDTAQPLPPMADSQVDDTAQTLPPVADSQVGGDTAQPLPPVADSQVGGITQPLPCMADSQVGGDTAQTLPPMVDSQVGDTTQPLAPVADSQVGGDTAHPLPPIADSQLNDTVQPPPPMMITSASDYSYYQTSSGSTPTNPAYYAAAAAYGQQAYNYAYAQNYNYAAQAYMQQAAAASYGVYGMQPAAQYYQSMYGSPSAYAYYGGTPYSTAAVPPPPPPPPSFQAPQAICNTTSIPPPLGPVVSIADSKATIVKKSDFAQSGSKEKQMKSMMDKWSTFKDSEAL